jgi:hypothetical protein
MAELQSSKQEEEDAMFTKKYVGPVDCASCDKGIVNLYGKQAEKVHWNKLPFREPGDRIAKVSYMFSLMICLLVWQGFQPVLGLGRSA